MATDTDTALAFLSGLYDRTPDDGWLNLFGVNRSTGGRLVEWCQLTNLLDMGPAVERLDQQGDTWFGVAVRRAQLGPYHRGGVTDCLRIPALWVDVDVAGLGHKLQGLPESLEEATNLIRSFPLAPTAVVRSGYGLQPWWLLTEPVEAAEAISVLARWAATWHALAAKAGFRLDSVFNLDRVMRLPGTHNRKVPGVALPVTVRAQWDVAHHLSEVLDQLDEVSEPAERQRAYTGHLAGSRFNERVTCSEVLADCGWQQLRQDVNGDVHWHYPGASNDQSASIYANDGHCTVWSETASAETGVPLQRPLDAYGLFTWLRHGGDFHASHVAVEAMGFHDDADDQPAAPAGATILDGPWLKYVTMSSIKPVPVRWLWNHWLPAGKLTCLDGDPDTGKSTMILDIAARLTVGADMPDGTPAGGRGDVILLAGEDDADDTISWRLMAAGADMDRVHVITGVQRVEADPFNIPGDLRMLADMIRRTRAVLVIVDVLNEYLSAKVDSHSDQDVRRALHRLKDVAYDCDCAVCFLRHLRKEGGKAIYRGGGSIGIVGAARAGWGVAYHPEDEALRVLAAVKANLTVKPQPLGFKLLQHPDYPCAQVVWQGRVNITADRLFGETSANGPIDRAKDSIKELLANGQEMSVKDFEEQMLKEGHKVATTRRARVALGVQSFQRRLQGINAHYVWLPGSSDDHDPDDQMF